MYTYVGIVLRVVDPDLLTVQIDLGFEMHHNADVRLADVAVPHDLYSEAYAFTRSWVNAHQRKIGLRTVKGIGCKYKGYLYDPTSVDTRTLNDMLRELVQR